MPLLAHIRTPLYEECYYSHVSSLDIVMVKGNQPPPPLSQFWLHFFGKIGTQFEICQNWKQLKKPCWECIFFMNRRAYCHTLASTINTYFHYLSNMFNIMRSSCEIVLEDLSSNFSGCAKSWSCESIVNLILEVFNCQKWGGKEKKKEKRVKIAKFIYLVFSV
jgi:hypothetical protein